MKSFHEFLAEGRDAPLYHGTRSFSIIERNELSPKTKHRNTHLLGARKSMVTHRIDSYGGVNVNTGVSLTRSMWVAAQFAELDSGDYGIVLELDQRKLAQTHQIIPINYNQDSNRGARTTKSGWSASEYEEFVPGGIKPLDRYLVTIWSNDPNHKLKLHPKFRLLSSDRRHKMLKGVSGEYKNDWEDVLSKGIWIPDN